MIVYLGDLSYHTPGAESQTYPLNIGFIKAYALSKLGKAVDISLFTDVDEICLAIKERPPDVLGLSYYIWNAFLSENVFKFAKAVSPYVLTVAGGHNLPRETETKNNFYKERVSFLDCCVMGEGEATFCELLEKRISKGTLKKTDLDIQSLECYDTESDQIIAGSPRERIKEIELIPSPILEGYLDSFITLAPMLQGVRGCPYGCKFCGMGSIYYNKTRHFSYERIIEEIEYVRKHNQSHNILHFTDDNFGMFDTDLRVLEYLRKSYDDTGWPIQIRVATAKRPTHKFIEAALKAPDMLRVSCHFQSLNPETLRFIQRINPSEEQLKLLYENFRQEKSNNMSETALIIPMPKETYASYCTALRKIIDDYQIEHCAVNTLSTFMGSGFETVFDEFKMKNKYRMEHGCFGEFREFSSCEIDRVCVETNTFSESEYYEARLFYYFCTIFYFKRNFFHLRSYLTQQGLSVYEWIEFMFERRSKATAAVGDYFEEVDGMTKGELFDSKEAVEAFWSDPENREKCVRGEFAFNVSQMVLGKLSFVYNDVLDFSSIHTKSFMASRGVRFSDEVDELVKMMKLLRLNRLEDSEIEKDIVVSFNYDFIGWQRDGFRKPLNEYRRATRIALAFTEAQKKDLKKLIRQYTKDNPVAVSKFYSRVLPRRYFRNLSYKEKR